MKPCRHPVPAALALVAALALGALVAGAAAKPQEPKPKPKPKLTLLTETEQEALRREAIKVGVRSRAGEKVRIEAQFVVDGFPDDFTFRLGPAGERLRDHEANVNLKLSQRQREVLDFAIKSCRGASIDLEATAAKRTGRLSADLAQPAECSAAHR